MSTAALPVVAEPRAVAAGTAVAWRASPYLHVGDDRLYNPHTDVTLVRGEAGYEALRALVEDGGTASELGEELASLAREGWLVADGTDLSRRYRIKYVSLEAHTVCNQACYFCPVSVEPRESVFMPTEMYERIVGEIAELAQPIEAVFMISYNEPTVDRRFVDQVRTIKEAGLPPATLTNGTGLTPERVDALVELGGLRFLSVNLSTIDRQRYRDERGGDHLERVLRNLDYAKDKPVGQDMHVVVLGTGDDVHQRDFDAISERFAGSRFRVEHWVVNDRAGYLQIGLKGRHREKRLAGCEHMGSRPIQHLHVNPRGECLLCCQDYNETVVVGDLSRNSLREVLEGDDFARARRWVYGQEDAPERFICHDCKFALKR